MPKTLPEYLDWLDERADLKWPQPAPPVPIKATPYLKPIAGVRAVAWSVYGTLLTIDSGQLQQVHPQAIRMQIALQKTIEEFKMWQSMSRKPGQPWEYMLQQYREQIDNSRMAPGKRGDVIEIDSATVWEKLIEKLQKNEYSYDAGLLGSTSELAQKVAYFFHASLQGVKAAEGAAATLRRLTVGGVRQGLLDDGQVFTVPQLLRALRQQDPIDRLADVVSPDCVTLSYQHHARKPSPTLFAAALDQYKRLGFQPSQVLYVTQRLRDDLVAAKTVGFRTALLTADQNCGQVELADVRNAEMKPDRLVTAIGQVLQLVAP
jgi:FMN phosphatase YigB (HAD superfamily)